MTPFGSKSEPRPSFPSAARLLPALLNQTEAADYLSVSRHMVRSWVRRGLLRTVKLPSTVEDSSKSFQRFDVRDLDAFIQKQRGKA